MKVKTLSVVSLMVVLSLLVTTCGPTPEPQTIVQTVEVEKTVVETVEVEKQVVETVEVEKTVIEEKVVEVTAVPAPKGPEGTLTMALSTFPNSIDRIQAAERQAANASTQLWDSLVWVNEEGELEPALAESYEISEDGTEYTFRLREDVVFHNGEPFNADAVVFTWERAVNADYEYSYYLERAESVEKIDDYTVKVTTPEPDALFLRLIADYWAMLPPQYYEEVGEEGFNEHPIGTGPFMLVEWVKGDHITMEANPNYWREGQPKVQNLIFRPIPESATRVAAIQTGEVDVVGRLSSEEAQSLLGVPNVKVIVI